MKRTIFFLALAFCALTSCNSSAQEGAKQSAEDILADMHNVMKQGYPTVGTSEEGYTMKAVIDGKPWAASTMLQINASNTNFIVGDDDNIQIHFYIFDRNWPAPPLGEEQKLRADLRIGSQLWKSSKGGYAITKVNDAVIEGRFHFSAKPFQSEETAEVTDGVFRVLLDENR